MNARLNRTVRRGTIDAATPAPAVSTQTAQTCAADGIVVAKRKGVSCATSLDVVRQWLAVPDAKLGNHGSADVAGFTCAATPAASPGPAACVSSDGSKKFEVTTLPKKGQTKPEVKATLAGTMDGGVHRYRVVLAGWQYDQVPAGSSTPITAQQPTGLHVSVDGVEVNGSDPGDLTCSDRGHFPLDWKTEDSVPLAKGTHTVTVTAGYCGVGGARPATATSTVTVG